jgi:DNA-binding MarR family transcriptional regulator
MTRHVDHELSIRQLSVLQQIAGDDTTPGDIARQLNVTPAVVTGLIDRMERRGYVRRFESQFDRRRVHVELTISGEDVRSLAEDQLLADLEAAISHLTPDEQSTIAEGMRLLRTAIAARPAAASANGA